MYENINKTQYYYLYDVSIGIHYYIGTFDDLLRFLASSFSIDWNTNELKSEYFDYLNLTMDDMYSISERQCFKNENGEISWYYNSILYLRKYVFYDGEYRIIDIREFKNDAIKYYQLHKFSSYQKRKNHRCRRRHHRSYTYRKMPRTKRTKTFNSIPECKNFVRKRDKVLPNYIDDTISYISCCWKDQYKCKKQWGHKNKKKDKNTKTIRTYDDNNYDMYELLQEEFDERDL